MGKILTPKGLTFVEILAVIVILAIIAVIAISSIQGIIQNQRDKAIISDIVNFVETARLVNMDNECENSICTYTTSGNSINYYSSKFTEGTVDFSAGTSRDKVVIKIPNFDTSVFKGRNAVKYSILFDDTDEFTEEELLNVLE